MTDPGIHPCPCCGTTVYTDDVKEPCYGCDGCVVYTPNYPGEGSNRADDS